MSQKKYDSLHELAEDAVARQNIDNIINTFINDAKYGQVRMDGSDELLNIIDRNVFSDDSPFYKTLEKGTVLFRARIVDLNNLNQDLGISLSCRGYSGFSEAESRESPLGYSGPGRNNIDGVSYLYVANNEQTACCEVKATPGQIISVAQFEIEKPLHIVDFTSVASSTPLIQYGEIKEIQELFERISYMYTKPVSCSAEYKATQYLTDYIRKTGTDGIAYNSFFESKGVNYTIFNSDHRNIRFCGSRLLTLQSVRHTFMDFNNSCVITASSRGGAKYNENTKINMVVALESALRRKNGIW